MRGLRERKITRPVAEANFVRCGYNEKGEINEYYFPMIKKGEVVGFKMKKIGDKKGTRVTGDYSGLFGFDQHRGGGRKIILTEGEEDKLAVDQASLAYYGKIYPSASMNGVDQTKFLIEEREDLRKFDEIVVWFDNDEPGQEAAKKAAAILGFDKVKIVKTDVKDACDKLAQTGGANKTDAANFMRAVWDASSYSPASIVKGEDTWEIYQKHKDISYVPWPPFLTRLNELTFGRAMGSITMIAAGCHGHGTEVLMADGSVSQIQEVEVGSTLAGPDGSPRRVLSLARGQQQMYRIHGFDHEYTCNEDHVLSLVYCRSQAKYSGVKKGDICNVTVRDYLSWNDTRKKSFKQYLGQGFDSSRRVSEPWLLGAWLGDGTSAAASLTNVDNEVWDEVQSVCDRQDWKLSDSSRITKYMSGGLLDWLRTRDVLNNKHIPEEYLTCSRADRLELLGGLLDTDGHYSERGGYYEITQKRRDLSEQILRLCKGLGLRSTLNVKFSKQWNRDYYRIRLFGSGIESIPCRVERKIARPSRSNRDSSHLGFSIEKLGIENYYGVHLDGDHLYQLSNGVVTHNTGVGKSTLLREDIYHLITTTDKKIGACFLEESIGETVSDIMGLHLNKRIGLPSTEVTEEEELSAWRATMGTGRVLMVDHQGSISDGSLLDKIEFLAVSGCEFIYLDHITIAVAELEERDTNKALDSFMSGLLSIVKKHNCWIGVVSHLRKVKQGEDSFESGGQIFEDDLKGSGSLKQISFQTIAISRNKLHDQEEKRHQSQIWLLKDRKTGASGPAGAYSFGATTGRLSAVDQTKDSFEFEEVEII